MNMTETSPYLDILEKVLGSLCIALMVFIVNKNSVKLNSMMCWGKNPITNNDGIIGLQLKDLRFKYLKFNKL